MKSNFCTPTVFCIYSRPQCRVTSGPFTYNNIYVEILLQRDSSYSGECFQNSPKDWKIPPLTSGQLGEPKTP